MKREEKSQKMRRKIMDSALAEFSSQGYGISSINTICAAENISKGIVYHYFATKDDLYLSCVEECFQLLTDYIRSNISKDDCPIEKHLRNYFSLRTHFFQEHPVYQRIFCEAVIAPPVHLKTDVAQSQSVLGELSPSKTVVKLAIPATLALLAKAVYNLVDTAYIGMLHSDIALTAVGVTVPLLLIMVSIENIFAAGAAVLAGRQLGANDKEGASRTVTTIIGISVMIGTVLCVGGIIFIEPL